MAPVDGLRHGLRAATAASVRPVAAPTAATVAVARPTTAAGRQAAAVRPAVAATAAATTTAEARPQPVATAPTKGGPQPVVAAAKSGSQLAATAKGGQQTVATVAKGGTQPAPTAAKGGPQTTATKGGPQPVATAAAKGGPQPVAPTAAAKGGPEPVTTAAKGGPHPVATGAAKGGPQAVGIAAKGGQKAVESLGPLDIWTLRDHMAANQKVAKGGKRIIDIFREIDTDRSGELSRDEFSIVLKKYGFISATDGEISAIVKLVDTDGSGSVKFSELERLIKGLGPRPPPVELEVLPPPPPPKPLRDRFPKAIDPDAAFAQPTHVQLSALAVNYWKRREHAGSRASSPRDLAHHQGSEGESAVSSLGLVRSRLGVVRANRSSSTTAEEVALLLRGGESHAGHTSQFSRERFVFKPSVAQGSFSPQRARDIMMTAGHVGSFSRSSRGREVRPRSTSPSTTASGAQSARSTSASPPRLLANDHLRDVGPDLAQLSVWKAARARSKPLALRHMQERLVQRYAVAARTET